MNQELGKPRVPPPPKPVLTLKERIKKLREEKQATLEKNPPKFSILKMIGLK